MDSELQTQEGERLGHSGLGMMSPLLVPSFLEEILSKDRKQIWGQYAKSTNNIANTDIVRNCYAFEKLPVILFLENQILFSQRKSPLNRSSHYMFDQHLQCLRKERAEKMGSRSRSCKKTHLECEIRVILKTKWHSN